MAVIAKQRYKLDIAPKGGWVIVYASQHDDGAREIEFEITNQGNAFSIPASINVSVQGTKVNGSYFSHSCSYSGNVVTMALADDMTDIVGKAICVLKFTNSSQQKLATAKFILNVDIDSSSEGIIIDTDAEEIFNQMLNEIRAQAASISADIVELQSMVGTPLIASTVSAMTDHNKIYVYTGSESGYTNGNWYYWNGSAWTSGGVYNSIAINIDSVPTQGSNNPVSSGGMYGVYETVYAPYTKYEQGGIDATTGGLIVHNNISRSGVIGMDVFKSMTKPSGWSGRYVVYTDKDGTVIDSVHNIAYTANITHTPESLLSLYPNIKAIRYHFQKYENGAGVTTTPEMLVALAPIIVNQLKTLPASVESLEEYKDNVLSQFFDFANQTITTDITFTINLGAEKCKNMIVKANAMYTGEKAPTFKVRRRWEHPTSGQWNYYYGSPEYHIGGMGQYKMQEWRIPQWMYGFRESLDCTITIPEGTTLYIKSLSNMYDDTIARVSDDLNLNAHGQCGYGGPANTLYSYSMAAKLGYKYCITIPKVTSDGVYVCFHDDGSIQAQARNDDGTVIANEYQNRPISDFTYSELLQFDFGIFRGKPFAGSRIPLLSEFFKICARTGMHPMLSVHPTLEGHWSNIKAMAKQYGVLNNLNIKAPGENIAIPMATLGDEIESYTIDDSSGISYINYFNSIKTTYGITKAKCVIEYKYSVLTDALITEVLNAGYVCGVYEITASDTKTRTDIQLELIDKGVTEFTEDYNCSVGLNWG